MESPRTPGSSLADVQGKQLPKTTPRRRAPLSSALRRWTRPASGDGTCAPAGTSLPTPTLRNATQGRRQGIDLRGLRVTASERRALLITVDLLMVNLALLAALILRYNYSVSWSTIYEARVYIVLLSAVWLAWASFFDCYDLPRTADASQSAWSVGRAGILAAVTYLAIPVYTPHFPASRLSAYLFAGLMTLSVPAWRALYAAVFSQPQFQTRILIVGAGRSGTELARELARTPAFGNPYAGSGYRLVGFVDDDPAKAGTTAAGAPVLGNRDDLEGLVVEHQIDTLVLAITHTPNIHPELFRALLACRERGVGLEPMTSLYERLTGKVAVDHAGRNLHVVMPPSETPWLRLFASGKRLTDLVAAVIGLVLLAVALPWIAAANALWSPGPLFYRQVRVGKGGRAFCLVKLRSMVPDAERENGAVWASPDDARVTPVGRFLRRARLDELPQFWNVLCGEMSLVGPRPERPEFVAGLLQQAPFYQVRHAVRPGITGWAQVRQGYGASTHDALVKLRYDLYYIKHQSPYLELSILVKTAAVILHLRGR